jgi:hypothetical protein
VRKTYATIAVLSCGLLLAACGGADGDDKSAERRQEEAAAMQRAIHLASQTNEARVKIERAKVAAMSGTPER